MRLQEVIMPNTSKSIYNATLVILVEELRKPYIAAVHTLPWVGIILKKSEINHT